MKKRLAVLTLMVGFLVAIVGCKSPFPEEPEAYEANLKQYGSIYKMEVVFEMPSGVEVALLQSYSILLTYFAETEMNGNKNFHNVDCALVDVDTMKSICLFEFPESTLVGGEILKVVITGYLDDAKMCNTLEKQNKPCDFSTPELGFQVVSGGFNNVTLESDDPVDPEDPSDEDPDVEEDMDSDGDGVDDVDDNCPMTYNNRQTDTDVDGVGDACDNCRFIPNPNQADSNDDSVGDACILDSDADGIPDTDDNCPHVENPDQANEDGDFRGDACDITLSESGSEEDEVAPERRFTMGNNGCSIVAGSDVNAASLFMILFVLVSLAIVYNRRRVSLHG